MWTIHDMRGSRDTVKVKVAGEKNIPADVKTFIAAQIDSLKPDVTGCRLDAYCQENNSAAGMTVTRNIQITITGIKL